MQCPLCKSEHIQPLLQSKDFANSKEAFEVYQCQNCHNAFTSNAPTAADIGPYYQHDDYISHTETNKGFINNLYLKARNYNLEKKTKLIQRYSSDNQLLDYGCGAGAFASFAQEKGYKTTGLDVAPEAIAAAKKKGVDAFHMEHLTQLPDNAFGVITLWHVLEHVHDIHETLQHLHRVCKQGGHIFIAVPNITAYDAKFYGRHWAALDLPRHLYHFTPKGLPPFVSNFGFEIQGQHPMPLDAYYVSLLSEKYKASLPKPLQMMRAGMVATVSNLKKQSQNQSSIIYVFTKR